LRLHRSTLRCCAVWLCSCVSEDNLPNPPKDVGSQVADGNSTDSQSQQDLSKADLKDQGPTDASDDTLFILDITCPDGSKPDLTSMPNCNDLVERVVEECCPKPKPGLNDYLAAMVCEQNADGLCKMILDSDQSFQMTCDETKTNENCI
jgi:hypothetical protein